MTVTFKYAATSEVGMVRKNNQDAFDVSDEHGLVVVADGMGGHKAGEIASDIAVKTVMDRLTQADWDDDGDEMQFLLKLGSAVESANKAIREEAFGKPELKGMGTTIVIAFFRIDRIFFAHVGDSRLYRLRKGRLQQLTKDHSLVQQLLDSGTFQTAKQAEEAGIGSNVLTRGLGVEEQVEVDVADEMLERGDIFLLCTDGLTNMVPDKDIERLMNHYLSDLDSAVERLMLGALSAGGSDNITLALIKPDL